MPPQENTTSQGTPTADPKNQTTGEGSQDTTVKTPATTPDTPKVYTQKELDAAREVVRKEEKDKLYGRLNTSESNEKDANVTISAQEKKIKEYEEADKLRKKTEEDARKAKLPEMDRVKEEQKEMRTALADIREQNALQARLLKEQDEKHEKELKALELRAYRDKKVAAANLHFAEMVSGSTEAEIDASIEKVKASEEAYKAQLQASTTDVLNTELGTNVPKPKESATNPEGGSGAGDITFKVLTDREAASLPVDEFKKYKAALRARAKSS